MAGSVCRPAQSMQSEPNNSNSEADYAKVRQVNQCRAAPGCWRCCRLQKVAEIYSLRSLTLSPMSANASRRLFLSFPLSGLYPRELSSVCTPHRLLHTSCRTHRSPVRPPSAANETGSLRSSESHPSTGDRAHPKEKSRHAEWYSTTLPAMVPIAILAYAVYLVSGKLLSTCPFRNLTLVGTDTLGPQTRSRSSLP